MRIASKRKEKESLPNQNLKTTLGSSFLNCVARLEGSKSFGRAFLCPALCMYNKPISKKVYATGGNLLQKSGDGRLPGDRDRSGNAAIEQQREERGRPGNRHSYPNRTQIQRWNHSDTYGDDTSGS